MISLCKMPSFSIHLLMVMVFFTRGRLTDAQCPTLTIEDAACVRSVDASDTCNYQVDIYEDCPVGTNLFTIEGTGVSITACSGTFGGDGSAMVLQSALNAESKRSFFCSDSISIGDVSYSCAYTVLDVDEFLPSLLDQGPAETIYKDENNEPGMTLLNITLGDDDYGETMTMEAKLSSTENFFAIERTGSCDDATCTAAEFILTVTKSLDYETGVFYEIDIEFTSTDERGESNSTSMKVLLFLNDISDNPPFWLQPISSASFLESDSAIANIIDVEARDRDTAVENAICYRINSGNEDGYFAIDEKTGEVSCPSGIDREALSQTSFQLTFMAIEVLSADCTDVAGQPNNVTQETTLQVEDVNDNLPEFSVENLAVNMTELTTGGQSTSATFNVTDLDEGAAGSYTVSSDDAVHLGFDHDSGSGITSFVIEAFYDADDNIFDYEKMTGGNYDLSFIITATEDADPTHVNSISVTITLEDVNDVYPVFEEEIYNISVPENSVPGTSVVVVQATDGDTSPEFGTPSVRYYLSQCDNYFEIDTVTGDVTVTTNDALDYENVQKISCGLEGRDSMGESPYLPGTATLVVVLQDLDDTPPIITVQDAEVSEAEEVGGVVTDISVRDADTQASISFSIEYEVGTADSVKSWFSIQTRECSEPNLGVFCADLVVASELDRETQEEVHLTIVATDDNTAENEPSDSSEIIITLLDVNDVAPSFCENYEDGLSVYENDGEGTQIAQICASDLDNDDVLEFSLSDSSQVAIDPESGILSVVTPLDRETENMITVTITVTDLANHTDTVEASITVKDRNDNAPQLSEGFCETTYDVSEAAPNGTEIAVATATDADEGAHANVSYNILNAQAGSPLIPFDVDPVTGSITVSLDLVNSIFLDRETQDEWLLQLQAYDNCELNEAFCDPKVTSCVITVTVGDVNDNIPYLDSNIIIYPSEELKQGENVPDSTITARDKDLQNTVATEIHYVVTEFVNLTTGEAEELAFYAVDFNETDASGIMVWSCSLETTKNLTHMAGTYNLTVQATDGSPEDPGNVADLIISIEITDANDYIPEIVMKDCLLETNQHALISEEMYAGEDCIPCYDGGSAIEMTYIDQDASAPNNEAVISVDYNNSVVYPLGELGQLEYFEMKYSFYEWNLCLKEGSKNLSLESAVAYNLSLRVEDGGTPTLFSYDWIFLNLTPVSEFDPNFGQDVSDCYFTTYILEDTTNIGAFRAAEDEDNAGQIYDIIFYYIVGGDASLFSIPNSTVAELQPVNPLDRDDGPGQYTILIQATNSLQSPPSQEGVLPTGTDMLQLTIVLMDQNDNPPVFISSVFYGSVLQSGSTNQLAAELVATDKDLNETLDYQRVTDLMWENGENYGDEVFEVLDDGVTGTVWLRQDPGSLSGYCVFTAQVNDRNKDEHQDTAFVQIFIVKSDDEVPFRFKNDIATLQEAQGDIEMILSATFGYDAFVDSMSPTAGADNTTQDSVVEAHFVNSSLTLRAGSASPGNLVSPNIIESMASSALTSAQLQDAMGDVGLELYQVGNFEIDDDDSLEAQLLTYQIVLGVVSIVLLSIVFLLTTAYCVRTRKLERRVKVLTTNTFGSQASDLNKTGVAAAPNSNLFKGEGTNPVFNISLQEFNNQDNRSISSGDSVLVGVEDNPEFRDYKVDQERNSKADAPTFVGTDGVASNNPLFSVQASAPARSNDGSDAGSFEDGDLGSLNPNFVFQ